MTVGLKISEDKTKQMQIGNVQNNILITLGGFVEKCHDLGSIMDTDAETEPDVKCWIGKATAVF